MPYIWGLDAAKNENLKDPDSSTDNVLVCDIEIGIPSIVKDHLLC